MKAEKLIPVIAKNLAKKVDVDDLIYNAADTVSLLGTNYHKEFWFGPWHINIRVQSQRD